MYKATSGWWRPAPVVRWPLVAGLVLALFAMGVYDEVLFAFFGKIWHQFFAVMGLEAPAALEQGLHRRVTRRPLMQVMTYAAVYVGLCLLLFRLLLRTRAQWQLTLRLYAGVVAAYLLIAVGGKLAGDAIWAYRLSRHLIDFVVSPVPVAGLLVLFGAGFGPADEPTDEPVTE